MAPELLNPLQFGFTHSNPSGESDIFSFAMTAYEVFPSSLMTASLTNTSHDQVLSEILPYGNGTGPESVTAFSITSGKRPPRPNSPTAVHWLPDPIWDVIERCWDQAPWSRLSVDLLRQAFVESEQAQEESTPVTSTLVANTPVIRSRRGERVAV